MQVHYSYYPSYIRCNLVYSAISISIVSGVDWPCEIYFWLGLVLMVEIFHSLSFGRHRKGGREPFTSGVPFFCGARILKALAEGTCLQIMSSRMETEVAMIWGAIAEKHFCEVAKRILVVGFPEKLALNHFGL